MRAGCKLFPKQKQLRPAQTMTAAPCKCCGIVWRLPQQPHPPRSCLLYTSDTGFRITGEPVKNFTHMFLTFWNAFSLEKEAGQLAMPPYPKRYPAPPHTFDAVSYTHLLGQQDNISAVNRQSGDRFRQRFIVDTNRMADPYCQIQRHKGATRHGLRWDPALLPPCVPSMAKGVGRQTP